MGKRAALGSQMSIKNPLNSKGKGQPKQQPQNNFPSDYHVGNCLLTLVLKNKYYPIYFVDKLYIG